MTNIPRSIFSPIAFSYMSDDISKKISGVFFACKEIYWAHLIFIEEERA